MTIARTFYKLLWVGLFLQVLVHLAAFYFLPTRVFFASETEQMLYSIVSRSISPINALSNTLLTLSALYFIPKLLRQMFPEVG